MSNLQHVPHRGTKSMVNQSKVEVTSLLDERGDAGVVSAEGEDTFNEVGQRRIF
jgi:hypothetical protein